jgi:proline dehydrogenase
MSLDRAILLRLATSEGMERAVKRMPGGERAAWRAASQYVAGQTQSEAIKAATRLLGHGHGVSIDLFGEHVRDPAEADRVLERYLSLVAALPSAHAWLSVDLSHFALSTDLRVLASGSPPSPAPYPPTDACKSARRKRR